MFHHRSHTRDRDPFRSLTGKYIYLSHLGMCGILSNAYTLQDISALEKNGTVNIWHGKK